MTDLPEHLGGHLNKVHVDRGILLNMINTCGVKSMLDIGCGPGDMVELARNRRLDAVGIDGDFTLELNPTLFVTHDFTTGTVTDPLVDKEFDLAWSVEFLEHVEEKYIPNFMPEFAKCKHVVCTAAPPGHTGHHHVNCQPTEYWIDVFGEYGFSYDGDKTTELKEASLMRKPFYKKHGMFFRKV